MIALAHIAQQVEHILGKNEVIGSNPIVGSPMFVWLLDHFRVSSVLIREEQSWQPPFRAVPYS